MIASTFSVRREIVPTSLGDVMLRRCGEGPAIVLLHWTPLSGEMFTFLMPHLAEAGYACFAFDLLGYGQSDPRPESFSISGYADNVREALDHVGIDKVALALGGHNGASVALELALRDADRIHSVAVDGLPFLTHELRVQLQKMRDAPPISTDFPDWHAIPQRAAHGLIEEYTPGIALDDTSMKRFWDYMRHFLQTGFVSSAPVTLSYVVEDRLPSLSQPLLVMGAETDSLASAYQRTLDLKPDAASHWFSGHNPLYLGDGASYAAPILSFLTAMAHA